LSPKILLLGSSGQVGSALARLADAVTAPTRRELDLTTVNLESAHRLIIASRADVLVNCAAYTAVDRAEDEPALADAVNGAAVGILAEATAAAGIPFVTYSTDYVFDGTATRPYLESAPPDPVNAYGQSKLIGERLSLTSNPRALVIRTSWVISGTHPNFVATMLRLAKEGQPARVVDDQVGCPTSAEDLAAATLAALDRSATGLLHLTNDGETTWHDMARFAVSEAGLDPDLIRPCMTNEYPTRARRPAYSVLGSERIDEIGIPRLPPWQQSLPTLVAQILSW
jgi:dTDP-4-dehydrorhamnose reductase